VKVDVYTSPSAGEHCGTIVVRVGPTASATQTGTDVTPVQLKCPMYYNGILDVRVDGRGARQHRHHPSSAGRPRLLASENTWEHAQVFTASRTKLELSNYDKNRSRGGREEQKPHRLTADVRPDISRDKSRPKRPASAGPVRSGVKWDF
jgi:hypothetical protein